MTDKDVLGEIREEIARLDVGIGSVSNLVSLAMKAALEVERLRYDNDNFAHENDSLAGDVKAIQERKRIEIESLTKDLEEVKNDRDSWKKIAEQLQDKWLGLEEELEEAKAELVYSRAETQVVTESMELFENDHKKELEAVKKERDEANKMLIDNAKLDAASKVLELEAENRELNITVHDIDLERTELKQEIAELKAKMEELDPWVGRAIDAPRCKDCGQVDVRIPRLGIYHVCPVDGVTS